MDRSPNVNIVYGGEVFSDSLYSKQAAYIQARRTYVPGVDKLACNLLYRGVPILT